LQHRLLLPAMALARGDEADAAMAVLPWYNR
jgi:hypothetical protein